jgi:type IV pilus assembly protein PilX
MNPHRRFPSPSRPRGGQRGISLVVSLILLVVATLVALGSMRGVVLQSRMSATTHDRSLAFQAAEAALRDAETRAATATSASFPASNCSNGFCAQPALADTPRWLDTGFNQWRAAAGVTVPADAPAPEAIVEDMGEASNWPGCENEVPRQPNCLTRRYLISSRSTAEGRASVLVQSQFAAP